MACRSLTAIEQDYSPGEDNKLSTRTGAAQFNRSVQGAKKSSHRTKVGLG